MISSVNLVRNLILAVIASLAFYAFWVFIAGPSDVWIEVKHFGLFGWFVVLGLSFFNYLLRFARWHLYLKHLNYEVPKWVNFRFYLVGFAFTTTPGKVGEAIRSLYLKSYSVKYTDSIAAFFVERLVDVIAMLLLSLLAAYVFEDWRWLIIALAVPLVLFLPFFK